MVEEFMAFDLDDIHLLDTCAKIALPFLLEKNHSRNSTKDWPGIFTDIAETSYQIAHEMLKAQKKLIAELERQEEIVF
jgi:hypothetical protein